MVLLLLPLLGLLLAGTAEAKPQVLMVSFDGFRWDYIDRYKPPNFMKLAKEGVFAPRGVRNPFVTKTFPDHYTLVTGLYEESHGIVGNRMWDPEFQEFFNPGNSETRWWDGGEPIWITAALQGLRSGVFFWPGSEARIRNITATEFRPYDKTVSFSTRVKQALKWLQDGFDLVLVYFHEPDSQGHQYGPNSTQVGDAVQICDSTLKKLLDGLDARNLSGSVDLLVLSDHGMAKVIYDNEHILELDKHINFQTEVERVVEEGVYFTFYPKAGLEDELYQRLKNISFNMTVYRKEEIPEIYHYKRHRRVPPFFLLAKEGYLIFQNDSWTRRMRINSIGGQHGYSNFQISMNPIFLARGPHFKQDYSAEKFETVHLYPLVCHLLGLSPAPSNGTLEMVMPLISSGVSFGSTLTAMAVLVTLLQKLFEQVFV